MVIGELRTKIDKIWDTIWTGGISSPTSVLEQITYLMFMKLLDDNEIKKEGNAALLEIEYNYTNYIIIHFFAFFNKKRYYETDFI